MLRILASSKNSQVEHSNITKENGMPMVNETAVEFTCGQMDWFTKVISLKESVKAGAGVFTPMVASTRGNGKIVRGKEQAKKLMQMVNSMWATIIKEICMDMVFSHGQMDGSTKANLSTEKRKVRVFFTIQTEVNMRERLKMENNMVEVLYMQFR
jgi:hypothetical protein